MDNMLFNCKNLEEKGCSVCILSPEVDTSVRWGRSSVKFKYQQTQSLTSCNVETEFSLQMLNPECFGEDWAGSVV